MNFLYHIDGDVTDSQWTGNQIIAHVCTEAGDWSGQKSKTMARKWPQTRRAYRKCYLSRTNYQLGCVQFVNVHQTESDDLIRVANMIARPDIKRPIQYRALRRCLKTVARKAIKIGASVHMPNFFDGQTDDWSDLKLIIYNTLCTARISVYVYDSSSPIGDQCLPRSDSSATSWMHQASES